MKTKKSHHKIDWNLLLTTISAIAALASVYSAFTANKIAQESQVPEPIVTYVGEFHDYSQDKLPCKTAMGYSEWQIDFAVGFDVSNFGGKPDSLIKIDYNPNVETFHPSINASIDYEFFGTSEELTNWLQTHNSPFDSWVKQSKNKLDYSSPPINIGSGETHRIILPATEEIRIEDNLSPQQAVEALRNVNLNSGISFQFANGDTKQEMIQLINPFSSVLFISLSDFNLCSPAASPTFVPIPPMP